MSTTSTIKQQTTRLESYERVGAAANETKEQSTANERVWDHSWERQKRGPRPKLDGMPQTKRSACHTKILTARKLEKNNELTPNRVH